MRGKERQENQRQEEGSVKKDKERDFEKNKVLHRCYTGHCLPYKPQFHCFQVRVYTPQCKKYSHSIASNSSNYTRPRGRDLLSSLDHGDSVLGLRGPYVLSGYDLGQLHMREVGVTYPPEV